MKRLLYQTLFASSALYAGATGVVSALPEAGVISFGSVTIQRSGTHAVISQTTDRAVVDWQSFDVNTGEHIHFAQPSSSSAILNRVHDTDASRIDGALTANGQVYISNPNGMVFGNGAQVDVGSLVATTADIADKDFMAGGTLEFNKPGNPAAIVTNHGSISVKDGGLAALVAPNVENSGVITAKSGTVALAAGDTATVDFYGDELLSVAVSDKVKRQSVTNSGTLSAKNGGTVRMTTAQASSVIDSAINMDGLADASSATQKGGVIFFGGQDTTITLGKNASVKATGKTGGGTVHIGGAYQGKGKTPTARHTTIAAGATIDASATNNGNGGEVIVWADKTTHFSGHIKATGGTTGGNGGFVETSGKEKLASAGGVDASAFRGEAGQWLLDPTNAILANGAGTDASAGGTFNGQAAIDAATIQTALNGGTSVTITTTSGGADAGNITLSNATISKTSGGDTILTLKAENSILTTGTNSITSSAGMLGFILWADSDNVGGGAISLSNTAVTTNGGTFFAGGGLDNGANGGTAGDNIPDNFAIGTALHDDGIQFSNTVISTDTGTITLLGKGLDNAATSSHSGISMAGASQLATTEGAITLKGNGGLGTTNNSGVVLYGAGTGITSQSGGITLTGQGGGDSSAATSWNYGVSISNGAQISSTGTGATAADITINATAGNDAGGGHGINITSSGTLITTKDGDISITGRSGSNGAAGNHDNYALTLSSGADITSTGTGTDAGKITLHGIGTAAGEDNNRGLFISDAGTTVSTIDGAIDLRGEGGGNGMAGSDNNYGILMNTSANVTSSGKGNISLTGTGGNGGVNNRGIYLLGGGTVSSTGTGANAATITLNGTGGVGTNSNFGVFINGTNTGVSTVDGTVTITGTGRGTGSSNHGINMALDGDVTSSGLGTLSLTGTAGSGAGTNYGIHIADAGSSVTSGKGNISLTGIGGDGNANNRGIYLLNGGAIKSTGTGADAATITLNGTGGIGTNSNFGVFINGAGSQVVSKDGDISITGTGRGTGDGNHGINLALDGDILSTGSADISLTGIAGAGAASRDLYASGATITIGGGTDTGDILLSLLTHSLANTSFQTAGNITIQPRDASATIGVAGGAGALDISAGLLGMMNAGGTLTIGRADGDGAMTIGSYALWSTRAGTGIRFLSDDGAITLAAGAHGFGARNLTIETDADPAVVGSVTGTGILTLMPSSAPQTMGVAGGAGTVNVSNAELGNLGTGWSAVNLGRTDGAGLLTQGAFTWFAPTAWRAAAAGAGVLISAVQSTSAASNATFTFGAPVNLSGNLDTSAATSGTRAIALNGATTHNANTTITAGSGNVSFGSTLNGNGTLGITTTGNVTFAGAAGNITPLGNLTVTGAHNVAATGGVNVGGDVNVVATNSITGNYTGIGGSLNAGAGTVTATTSFNTLDIQGAGAMLSAGYIGASGAPTQNMANQISIAGVSYPHLTPNAAYSFAGFTIGQPPPGGGSSGGGGGASAGAPAFPIASPPPATPDSPTPPATSGGGNAGSPSLPATGSSGSGVGGAPSPQPPQTTLLSLTTELQHNAPRYDGSSAESPSDDKPVVNDAFLHERQSFTQTLLEYSEELLEMIGCGAGNADDSCSRL